MSFLPEDYLERRAVRRTNLICITLFVIVVGGVIGAYWMTYQRADEIRQMQAQVNADFNDAAERLEKLNELQDRKRRTIQKAEITSALVERIPRTLLLAELINHMPMELSLLEFELETRTLRSGDRPRTSLERRRQELSEQNQRAEVPATQMSIYIEGTAPTDMEVAQFMTALSQHKMFDDLDLEFSEQTRIEERSMRKFRIAMKVNQAADFDNFEPTRVRRGLEQDPMADTFELMQDDGLISSDGEFISPASDTYPPSED